MYQLKYTARHEFTYDGVVYHPGDEWRPQGLRNDAGIIKYHVHEERVSVDAPTPHPPAAKRPSGRRKR